MRDDFDSKTKDILFKRAGSKCSNPNCRKSTSGPHLDANKSINIGVAAHITAASDGGPRYEPSLSKEERKSIENGIWLCQDCAKLIDSDEKRYSIDYLRKWKEISEEAARWDIEGIATMENKVVKDIEIIKYFSVCFDRPAFQDEFMQEGSIEAFDKAMEDTIIAINTGCLRDRNGQILSQGYGKSFLHNTKWREIMDEVVDLIRAMRSRYIQAIKFGEIHVNQIDEAKHFYCFHGNYRDLSEWFDRTRADIINQFSVICKEVGISDLRFPRNIRFRRH